MNKVFLAALTTGLTVVVLCIVMTAVSAFILNNCDPKFGCAGTVGFIGILASAAGAISAIAYVVVAFLSRSINDVEFKVAVISGVILSPVVFTILNWTIGDIEMIFGWFFLSVGVVFLVSIVTPSKKHKYSYL